MTDIAGNRRAFTYAVSKVDTTKPVITLASGAYRIGTTTQDAITATLTFTDAESTITNRGYLISQYSTPAGSYRTYESALKLSDAGTYYIHAYAVITSYSIHYTKLYEMSHGVEVAVITGRTSQVVVHRMKNLGITHVYQGKLEKLPAYQSYNFV